MAAKPIINEAFEAFIFFESVRRPYIKEVLLRDGYGLRRSGHIETCGFAVQPVKAPGRTRHGITWSDEVDLV